MIEDLLRRAKVDPQQQRHYLFCMLKNRCQKVAVAICKKKECKYLEEPEENGIIDCHCPLSMTYVSAFKGNWKKRRQEEKEEQEAQEE
jgi:hypothetical protein